MNRAASTTVGVLVGGAVGAAAALLFAPKRGVEVRSDVKDWAVGMEHKAAGRIRDAGSAVASGIRQVPQVVAEKAPQMASKVGGMFTRGSQQAEHAAEEVERRSEQSAERMDRTAEQM